MWQQQRDYREDQDRTTSFVRNAQRLLALREQLPGPGQEVYRALQHALRQQSTGNVAAPILEKEFRKNLSVSFPWANDIKVRRMGAGNQWEVRIDGGPSIFCSVRLEVLGENPHLVHDIKSTARVVKDTLLDENGKWKKLLEQNHQSPSTATSPSPLLRRFEQECKIRSDHAFYERTTKKTAGSGWVEAGTTCLTCGRPKEEDQLNGEHCCVVYCTFQCAQCGHSWTTHHGRLRPDQTVMGQLCAQCRSDGSTKDWRVEPRENHDDQNWDYQSSRYSKRGMHQSELCNACREYGNCMGVFYDPFIVTQALSYLCGGPVFWHSYSDLCPELLIADMGPRSSVQVCLQPHVFVASHTDGRSDQDFQGDYSRQGQTDYSRPSQGDFSRPGQGGYPRSSQADYSRSSQGDFARPGQGDVARPSYQGQRGAGTSPRGPAETRRQPPQEQRAPIATFGQAQRSHHEPQRRTNPAEKQQSSKARLSEANLSQLEQGTVKDNPLLERFIQQAVPGGARRRGEPADSCDEQGLVFDDVLPPPSVISVPGSTEVWRPMTHLELPPRPASAAAAAGPVPAETSASNKAPASARNSDADTQSETVSHQAPVLQATPSVHATQMTWAEAAGNSDQATAEKAARKKHNKMTGVAAATPLLEGMPQVRRANFLQLVQRQAKIEHGRELDKADLAKMAEDYLALNGGDHEKAFLYLKALRGEVPGAEVPGAEHSSSSSPGSAPPGADLLPAQPAAAEPASFASSSSTAPVQLAVPDVLPPPAPAAPVPLVPSVAPVPPPTVPVPPPPAELTAQVPDALAAPQPEEPAATLELTEPAVPAQLSTPRSLTAGHLESASRGDRHPEPAG